MKQAAPKKLKKRELSQICHFTILVLNSQRDVQYRFKITVIEKLSSFLQKAVMEAGKKAAGFVTDFDNLIHRLKAEGVDRASRYSSKRSFLDRNNEDFSVHALLARFGALQAVRRASK